MSTLELFQEILLNFDIMYIDVDNYLTIVDHNPCLLQYDKILLPGM